MNERKLLRPDKFAQQVLDIVGEKPFTWAKKNNLERWVIERIQKGKIPDPQNLIKLANVLDVSLDWLLTGKGEQGQSYAAEEDANYKVVPLCSAEEKQYIKKLVEVLRNPATKKAIQENIDTFLKVPRPEPDKKKNEQ